MSMNPTPRPDNKPGRLDWTYSLDLTALDPSSQIDDTWALAGRWCRGRHVIVHVGRIEPLSLDSRVSYGLRVALRSGVSLTLDGHPRAVRSWWEAIHLEPAKPVRHLQLVGPS